MAIKLCTLFSLLDHSQLDMTFLPAPAFTTFIVWGLVIIRRVTDQKYGCSSWNAPLMLKIQWCKKTTRCNSVTQPIDQVARENEKKTLVILLDSKER